MNNTINRLIIIGNGFDLAHGMKTKYKDFVNGYLRQEIGKHRGGTSPKKTEDKLMSIIPSCFSDNLPPNSNYYTPSVEMLREYNDNLTPKQNLDKVRACGYEVKLSPFFDKIIEDIEDKNWVDIEYAYYEYLCSLLKKLDLSDEEDTKKEVSKEIDELNEEMKFITEKLVEYLKRKDGRVDENCIRIDEEPLRRKILDKMMMPLSKQEIAVEALEQWDSFVKEKYSTMHGKDDKTEFSQCKKDNGELNIEWLMEKYPKELRPDEIVILNFNYTSLAAAYHTRIADNLKYKDKGTAYLNQIHGTLYGKEEIIFGYGDDSGEMYKRLSDKNDNRLLENDKTVKYLGSFWYRNFFGFIESAPFQVCIMGHSCGISDRTLLSTIFQHENCVSIKPYYYYDKEKNSDDYYEIIKNISRCFDDKKLMRDRVVNKEYCEPLPQPVEKKNR